MKRPQDFRLKIRAKPLKQIQSLKQGPTYKKEGPDPNK